MLSRDSSASNPRVAVYDKSVYVVWTDNSSDGNRDIILRKSTDNGGTFDAAENLSNNSVTQPIRLSLPTVITSMLYGPMIHQVTLT